MELLVNDRLARPGDHGHPRQGDLAVTPVVGAHQHLAALRIASDDGELGRDVDIGKGVLDHLVKRQLAIVAPAREVNEARANPAPVEQQRGVEGRMRLAQRSQHLPNRQQVLVEPEMARRAQAPKVGQARANAFDPLVNEAVGDPAVVGVGKDALIVRPHLIGDAGQGIGPDRAFPGIGKKGVDPGLAGLLVLQQRVGDAGIGRHHENSIVERRARAIADQHGIQQLSGSGHRGAADLLNGMAHVRLGHGFPVASPAREALPVLVVTRFDQPSSPLSMASGASGSRELRNAGRGVLAAKGAPRRLDQAL